MPRLENLAYKLHFRKQTEPLRIIPLSPKDVNHLHGTFEFTNPPDPGRPWLSFVNANVQPFRDNLPDQKYFNYLRRQLRKSRNNSSKSLQ